MRLKTTTGVPSVDDITCQPPQQHQCQTKLFVHPHHTYTLLHPCICIKPCCENRPCCSMPHHAQNDGGKKQKIESRHCGKECGVGANAPAASVPISVLLLFHAYCNICHLVALLVQCGWILNHHCMHLLVCPCICDTAWPRAVPMALRGMALRPMACCWVAVSWRHVVAHRAFDRLCACQEHQHDAASFADHMRIGWYLGNNMAHGALHTLRSSWIGK
mmetsp:Transcript_11713/g.20829  ORF Transcript_11713/g.20829 Transcript_11713/m.20829 type:complete len:218 (+) Transcript_11713:290-943(+)